MFSWPEIVEAGSGWWQDKKRDMQELNRIIICGRYRWRSCITLQMLTGYHLSTAQVFWILYINSSKFPYSWEMITRITEYTLRFQEQEDAPCFIPYSKTQPIPTSRGGSRSTRMILLRPVGRGQNTKSDTRALCTFGNVHHVTIMKWRKKRFWDHLMTTSHWNASKETDLYDRAMIQTVSSRSLTAEARVQSKNSPRGTLRCTKWWWDMFQSQYSRFPLTESFHQCSILPLTLQL